MESPHKPQKPTCVCVCVCVCVWCVCVCVCVCVCEWKTCCAELKQVYKVGGLSAVKVLGHLPVHVCLFALTLNASDIFAISLSFIPSF